jgi:hypothetical protein
VKRCDFFFPFLEDFVCFFVAYGLGYGNVVRED